MADEDPDVRWVRERLKVAPAPYEFLSKYDFKKLPFNMRSFLDAYKAWLDHTKRGLEIE